MMMITADLLPYTCPIYAAYDIQAGPNPAISDQGGKKDKISDN